MIESCMLQLVSKSPSADSNKEKKIETTLYCLYQLKLVSEKCLVQDYNLLVL